MSYVPSEEILKKYADLIVNFSLNKGKPIEKGDVVLIEAIDYASPLVGQLASIIKKNGAEFLLHYYPANLKNSIIDQKLPTNIQNILCQNFKNKVDLSNKYINIRSIETEQYILTNETDYKVRKYEANQIREKGRLNKINKCLCLYPNRYLAKLANTDSKSIWNQIEKACFLNESNPIKKYKQVYNQLNTIKKYLNSLKIESIHIKGQDVDLNLKIGSSRKWTGGTYRNIPSFEIYTSPDYRRSDGWIKFNTPNLLYKNKIENVFLKFDNGELVDTRAKNNQQDLKKYFSCKNTSRIGEVSFTDKRISKIDKVLSCNLYDENFGGEYGNMHIGMGSSYVITLENHESLNAQEIQDSGLNSNCFFHKDFILRTAFEVTATLKNGKKLVIYKDGEYQTSI